MNASVVVLSKDSALFWLNPVFSPGFVTRVAKGIEMLGFSRIGRRRRSRTTLRRPRLNPASEWPMAGDRRPRPPIAASVELRTPSREEDSNGVQICGQQKPNE